jgi:hypothetical protein
MNFKEKTQVNKIRNIKGEITTNTKEIQRIIRGYSENLCSNKLESFKKMDKCLDTYDHPKLNQGVINHLHRSTVLNEIEAVIKSLPKKKSPGTNRFLAEF